MIQCSTAFNMVQQVLECLRNFLVELSLQNFRCLQQGNFTEQCREVQTLRLELLLRLQLGADPGGSWGPFRKTPTWNIWNIRNLRKKSLNHAELAQLKSPRKITTTTIGSECTLPNPQKAALINAATPTRTAVIIMNCLSKKLIERRWKANRRLTKSQAQWPEGQWQMRCDRWRIEACTLYYQLYWDVLYPAFPPPQEMAHNANHATIVVLLNYVHLDIRAQKIYMPNKQSSIGNIQNTL